MTRSTFMFWLKSLIYSILHCSFEAWFGSSWTHAVWRRWLWWWWGVEAQDCSMREDSTRLHGEGCVWSHYFPKAADMRWHRRIIVNFPCLLHHVPKGVMPAQGTRIHDFVHLQQPFSILIQLTTIPAITPHISTCWMHHPIHVCSHGGPGGYSLSKII